ATGVRGEILSPTAREDALHSLLTMAGVVPGFGIGAVRINSDILTWPETAEGLRREKVPAAPGGRYVGLVLLFSTETGAPLAIYPDGIVQRMRVGAACGLAAKYLARADARVLAILGAGWQAGGQAMAMAAVRDLAEIRCYGPTAERREAFAREWREALGTEVTAAASLEAAVDGADIVACATNSMQPVLAPELLRPGMHVSSIKRLELPPETVARADIVFTHVTGAESRTTRVKGADLASDTDRAKARMTSAIGQGEMPTLPDLLLDRAPGRSKETEITMFLNYAGLGFQFAATGAVILEKAKALGLGREIPTDWLTSALPS
ncbi:MAG: ornithine cyclodeaminase family protein, partial [Alphaproteobacteria bacterium]|nr:ornithine cyclodeaminase family protein [Alphaproteobacteria bacterium]